MRRLRAGSLRLQLLPQPTLSEVHQGLARAGWLEARQAELLPVPALPRRSSPYHRRWRRSRSRTSVRSTPSCSTLRPKAMRDIAAEPRHLGAEIGAVAVLHTWGQTAQHHPHLHCIVPGGGLSPDQTRWVACRPGFFLPVRVLSRRFRTLFLARLQAAFRGRRAAFLRHTRGPGRSLTPSPNVSIPCARSWMPSRWGCRHPHLSQTRTCRFPASGSSRERFARGGVAVEDLD